MDRRFLHFLFVIGGMLICSVANAQVTASLVAAQEDVRPGTPITVALKIEHNSGWHTYWVSPGIGEATSIEWTLPEGWAASDIDWPVPYTIFGADGGVTGHGYDGIIHLPVVLIAAPDATFGETVTLKAKVKWLMCELELCIPGGADLELVLPIGAAAQTNTRVQAALAATPMPEAGEGFNISATLAEELITLLVVGDAEISEPHFFSFDELVWHDVDQKYEINGGRLQATLPVDSYYEGELTSLSGVLAFTDAAGVYRGLLINAPLALDSAGATSIQLTTMSIWRALLFAFVGGVILNLMPCVLPILSMKALSLAQASGIEAAGVRRDGVLYTVGVIVSFIALAAILLAARSTFEGVGWGFHLQSPSVILSLALVMVAVGLNLLGVFEMGLGLSEVGQDLTTGHSAKASFFTGVLAVVVAAPCTAPFMAAALGAALVQPTPTALAIFAMLGVGLAFPYLLVTSVPSARSWLPKPGPWMATLRQALAFPMFTTAIWLLWVLGAQRGSDAMSLGLIAVLLLCIAGWGFGRQQRHGVSRLPWRVTILVALAMIPFLFAQIQKPEPGATTTTALEDRLFDEMPYSPAALDALLQSGTPVFAYFTADWCVTCKVNERVAIKTQATAAVFLEKGITVMVGDWTSQNPDITKMLLRYERAGVPMYVYFPAGATLGDGQLLPQILTPGIIADAVTGL